MKSTTKILQTQPSDWDMSVSHPLQSWAWGEFRKKMGIDVVRIDSYQITFHKIPHLPYTIGYFPKGPHPTDSMIDTLKKLGTEKNAIYIQLEPNVTSTGNWKLNEENVLRPSHHPLFTKYTFVIDLTKSEDQLLKDMHSKTRYNIKVAQKHGVVIKQDSSPKAFTEYLKLSDETTKRQGFYAHTPVYHQNMWETLFPMGIAKLWSASYEGKTLASWIIFCFNDTIYYPYGASSRENREVMAPNLLLWEIAKWGKINGYKKFDLWGAMGPEPDSTNPFYGFHRFKEGFRPDLVEFVGSFDLVIKPFMYNCYCFADTIRWKILKFKR